MWFKRDFDPKLSASGALPLKILKGPRQVGKTSLLEMMGTHKVIYFDDASTRHAAQSNPRFFLDQMGNRLILDEAPLVPEIFSELKRRVDSERRESRQAEVSPENQIDIWITGSNQTLLQKNVRESLSGRASYFDLNSLSIHELGRWDLATYALKGGWPELHKNADLNVSQYLNDLIATFIEKDIVSAAGIEKRSAFSKSLYLIAGRLAQLFNASDIATNVGVDVTTLQSWVSILEQNGILRRLDTFATNLNQRLIKSPKLYFEDCGLAMRLQGWTEFQPLFTSPMIGHLVENIALGEITRFFTNRAAHPNLHFVRSKEKVEVDFLVGLPNNRYIACEVKNTPQDFEKKQLQLLLSLGIPIQDRWVLSPQLGSQIENVKFENSRVVAFDQIWHELSEVW